SAVLGIGKLGPLARDGVERPDLPLAVARQVVGDCYFLAVGRPGGVLHGLLAVVEVVQLANGISVGVHREEAGIFGAHVGGVGYALAVGRPGGLHGPEGLVGIPGAAGFDLWAVPGEGQRLGTAGHVELVKVGEALIEAGVDYLPSVGGDSWL